LLSAFKYDVRDYRCNRLDVTSTMVNTMPQSKYINAADLHIYAPNAHAAAAAVHHRGDHEAAEELGSKAQDYSEQPLRKRLRLQGKSTSL
jgi:hypothetical protein